LKRICCEIRQVVTHRHIELLTPLFQASPPIDRCPESLHTMNDRGIDYRDRSDLMCGLLSCGMQVLCSLLVNHTPHDLECEAEGSKASMLP
jgi:hypothetical protein